MYVYKEEDAPLLVRPLLLFMGWKIREDKVCAVLVCLKGIT